MPDRTYYVGAPCCRIFSTVLVVVALLGAGTTSLAQEFHRVSMGVTGSLVTDGDLPQISDDGRHVSYTSTSDNIVAESNAGGQRVYEQSNGRP